MDRHCNLVRGFAALLLASAAGIGGAALAEEPGPNGFTLSNLRVPRDEIRAGGPPRDGIPSVQSPRFVAAPAARWVGETDPVTGVAVGDAAHAYPVHVMERHQVVNDVVGGMPLVATYDPLAGAPLAWERKLGDRTLEFGVSGLLYNGNFLLYDRETESLWVQFTGEAVAGPLAGKRLGRVRCRQETLLDWTARHPSTRVLALPDADRIDYRHSPYKRYWVQNRIPFPVKAKDLRFHAKELVLGVVAGGTTRAYLGSRITAKGGRLEDRIGGQAIRIEYSSELGAFRWEVPEGLEVTESYWFAWKAFHPGTEVWNDPGETPPLPQD